MEAQVLIQLVGSLGFPIVACCGMAYFFAKTNTSYREDMKEASARHKDEIDKLSEAINNNTKALELLIQKLGKDGD
mgnify:CR=1 FL=1